LLSLQLAVWFASGIVMTWVRFPAYDARERLADAPSLVGAEGIAIPPRLAAWLQTGGLGTGQRPRLALLAGRPAWLLTGRDGGRTAEVAAQAIAEIELDLERGGREVALARVRREAERRFGVPVAGATWLERGDQWTAPGFFRQWDPLVRVALEDGAGTHVHLSARTLEVVQVASRRERLLAWLGPIPHWVYYAALRRDGALWSDTVLVLAALGLVAGASGLVAGVAFARGLRGRAPAHAIADPYLRWHQRLGLGFGVLVCSWLLSGALTLDPFGWSGGTGLRGQESRALYAAPAAAAELPVAAALAACGAAIDVRELELAAFAGRTYAVCSDGAARTRIVDLQDSTLLVRTALEPKALERAAHVLAQGQAIAAHTLEPAPDEYFYPTHRTPAIALPYARVTLADRDATTFYIDPARAEVLRRHTPVTRLERWLRSGLHSLDFAWLYARPRLWRAVVIAAMAAGLALSGLGILMRLRRWRNSIRLR
jgi:hypothetical protein